MRHIGAYISLNGSYFVVSLFSHYKTFLDPVGQHYMNPKAKIHNNTWFP